MPARSPTRRTVAMIRADTRRQYRVKRASVIRKDTCRPLIVTALPATRPTSASDHAVSASVGRGGACPLVAWPGALGAEWLGASVLWPPPHAPFYPEVDTIGTIGTMAAPKQRWGARPRRSRTRTQKNVWQAAPCSPAAKCFVWQQQVVALMEPEGRVQLLNLADGRTLIDEVEPVTVTQPDKTTRTSLAEIYLMGSRDHYVLVANGVSQHDIAVNTVQPIPYGYTHPMNPRVHGRVYGFDRVSGKKLWSVETLRQGILLEQPSELPVVFFAATTYEQNQALPGAPRRHSRCCAWIGAWAARSTRRTALPARSAISTWWAIRKRKRSICALCANGLHDLYRPAGPADQRSQSGRARQGRGRQAIVAAEAVLNAILRSREAK